MNKILASVALICAHGNKVLLKDTGGDLIDIAAGKSTAFRRLGNIYVLCAWIPCPDFKLAPKNNDGEMLRFTRPGCSRLLRRRPSVPKRASSINSSQGM